MQKIRIITEDEFDILDTISLVHYSKEKPLIFQVSEKDGTNLNMRFEFVNIKDKIQSEIELIHFNQETLTIRIKYGNSLNNFGFKDPILIGSFDGRQLFFNFRITINSDEDKPLINFTLYVGKEVES